MLPRGGVSAPGITTKARRAALAGVALAVLMLGTEALAACAAAGDEIVVRVNQLRNGAGNVVAVLYGDNPDDFLRKGRKLAKVWTPAREGTVDVCLNGAPTGHLRGRRLSRRERQCPLRQDLDRASRRGLRHIEQPANLPCAAPLRRGQIRGHGRAHGDRHRHPLLSRARVQGAQTG